MKTPSVPMLAAYAVVFIAAQAVASALISGFRPDPPGLLHPSPEQRIKADPDATPMRVRPPANAATPKAKPFSPTSTSSPTPTSSPTSTPAPAARAKPGAAQPAPAAPAPAAPAPAAPAPAASPAVAPAPVGPAYGASRTAYGPAFERGPGDLQPTSAWPRNPGPTGPGNL